MLQSFNLLVNWQTTWCQLNLQFDLHKFYWKYVFWVWRDKWNEQVEPSTALVEKKARFLVSSGLSCVQSALRDCASDSPVSDELSTCSAIPYSLETVRGPDEKQSLSILVASCILNFTVRLLILRKSSLKCIKVKHDSVWCQNNCKNSCKNSCKKDWPHRPQYIALNAALKLLTGLFEKL